jgi:hypothetical protein
MAKRSNLRLVTPLTHERLPARRNARHPAGVLRLQPSVRDRDRIVALEDALIRVAGICSDRPDATAIISGVLFDYAD